MNEVILNKLVRRATPFLRINGATPMAWRRNVKSGGRAGPWPYKAQYSVISEPTWRRTGEVIYFVTDGTQRLRLVGQSSSRLMDRWRVSPMHDVLTSQPLGQEALFHSSAWPAIERGFDKEGGPFTVSALFRQDLEQICRDIGGPLAVALDTPEEGSRLLSYHVETWVCGLSRSGLDLWNRQKT